MLGHADGVDALFALDVAVGVGQHIQFAAPGADFLHIALELVDQFVVGGDHHHRHGSRHQRQRAVLEFAGRVGFGVDVADFLEFEGALKRHRVMDAAPQEQGIVFFGERFRPLHQLRLQRQHRLHGKWQVAHLAQIGCLLLVR